MFGTDGWRARSRSRPLSAGPKMYEGRSPPLLGSERRRHPGVLHELRGADRRRLHRHHGQCPQPLRVRPGNREPHRPHGSIAKTRRRRRGQASCRSQTTALRLLRRRRRLKGVTKNPCRTPRAWNRSPGRTTCMCPMTAHASSRHWRQDETDWLNGGQRPPKLARRSTRPCSRPELAARRSSQNAP